MSFQETGPYFAAVEGGGAGQPSPHWKDTCDSGSHGCACSTHLRTTTVPTRRDATLANIIASTVLLHILESGGEEKEERRGGCEQRARLESAQDRTQQRVQLARHVVATQYEPG